MRTDQKKPLNEINLNNEKKSFPRFSRLGSGPLLTLPKQQNSERRFIAINLNYSDQVIKIPFD